MDTRTCCLWTAAYDRCRVPMAGLTIAVVGLLLGSACIAQTRPAKAMRAAMLPPPMSAQAAAKAGESIWMAASDRALDRMRGGFDLGAGLMVSFGISRAVYSNGELLTSTSFQVGDFNRLTATQAAALSRQISAQTQSVNRGAGNTVEIGTGSAPMATYIQNTLNNQTLRNHTVIDAASNGMGMVKGLNLQATIDQAIADAIGTR